MISNKDRLIKVLKLEKAMYFKDMSYFESFVTSDQSYYVYKFIRYLRKTEYYHNLSKTNRLFKIGYLFFRRKKNILGLKLGIEIWDNSIDEGLMIYHAGNIVINGGAQIGKNLKLHGNNCIGNNGHTMSAPVIGNDVRLGVGAKIIGDVYLADGITVAAGAVVISSFFEKGITIAGVPARKVK